MKVLARRERTRVPWRNGRGWTWTVAHVADGNGTDDRWRVSLAEITEDGPFSRFSGLERVLVLADGAGLALTVDGVRHCLDAHGQLRFDGGAAVTCELMDGRAVTALNVMCAARVVRSAVEVAKVAESGAAGGATGRSQLTAPAEGDLVVVSLGGALEASTPGGAVSRLGRWDALWCRAGESVTLVSGDGAAVVAVVTLEPAEEPSGLS